MMNDHETTGHVNATLIDRLQQDTEKIDNLVRGTQVSINRFISMGKAFVELSNKVDHISVLLNELSLKSINPPRQTRSASLANLAPAYTAAKKKIKLADPTGSNGRGTEKSADYGDYYDLANPILSEHDLSTLFEERCDNDKLPLLTLLLLHSSGEFIESTAPLIIESGGDANQQKSKAITYAMKNLYRSLLGLGKE